MVSVDCKHVCELPASRTDRDFFQSFYITLTLVDLAEYHNTRELGLWVVGDLRVEGEDAHATTILGGHIFERLLDQHGGYDDLLLYCVFTFVVRLHVLMTARSE